MQNLKFAFSSIMAPQDALFSHYDRDYYWCFISCCDYGFGGFHVSSG